MPTCILSGQKPKLTAADVGAATEADVEGAKPMLRTATI